MVNYILVHRYTYKGFSVTFSENFRCYSTYCKSANFSGPSFHHIFEFENFRFPFMREIALPEQ